MFLRLICPGCQRPGPGLCPHCLAAAQRVGVISRLTELDAVAALYRYDSQIRRLILAAKNNGRRDVLAGFGTPLAALANGSGFRRSLQNGSSPPVGTRFEAMGHGFDVVTWVPASRQGRRLRGFDQGRLLARSVAAELSLPSRPLLLRSRGAPQTGRGRDGRRTGPPLRAPVAIRGNVLVVDDVITTGGSLCAAERAIRQAGADAVAAVVVAWNASMPEVQAGRPLLTCSTAARDRADS